MPNVTLAPQARLLTTDKALTSPTLSGLSDLWQHAHRRRRRMGGQRTDRRRQPAGRRAGPQDRSPTSRARSTSACSRAAEECTGPDSPRLPRSVAIQPSTGDLLAVGQNARRRRAGPDRADGPLSAWVDVQDGDRLGRSAGRPGHARQRRAPARAPRTSRAARSPTTTISTSARCRCTPRSRGHATPRWAGSRSICRPTA